MAEHEEENEEPKPPSEAKPELSSDFIDHVKALSKKAEESEAINRQLGLGLPDEEPVAGSEAPAPDAADLADVQNPDEAHRLFWAIQHELMAGLPRGIAHKELRDIVYEEKGDYINRGKLKNAAGIRGSDQRAGYLTHLRRALRVVRRWRREGGTAFDIWYEFRKMNEDAGYRPKQEGPLSIQGSLDDVLKAAVSGDKNKRKPN
jgi:hypothetical protein